MAQQKIYFSTLKDARKAQQERNTLSNNVHVFKIRKNKYVVCSELEWISGWYK